MIIYKDNSSKISYISNLLACLQGCKKEFGSFATNETRLKIFQVLESEDLIPQPEIIIKEIPKPLITPEDKLIYKRNWYLEQKRQKEIQNEKERLKSKIDRALKLKKHLCFNCHKQVLVVNPKAEVVQKKFTKNIIISFVCPYCNSNERAFGGYYV